MRNLHLLLPLAIVLVSCQQKNGEEAALEIVADEVEQSSTETVAQEIEAVALDWEKIPYSNADIGVFPYFTLPEGLTTRNRIFDKKYDVCFFPINGTMTPFEGRLYKVDVVGEEDFSKRYFEKSMEDYLLSIGAVKIFEGEISSDEYYRFSPQDYNMGNAGGIGYVGENIHFYALRSKEQGNIYIQFTSDNAAGKLNVLLEEAFVQTMTKVLADEIVSDLSAKGKSILHINFEVDQSAIASDGKEVVRQIAKALQQDPSLHVSIEGHTDSDGDLSHNKKLSNDRAHAVMRFLVSEGIEQSRLTAKGFGSEKPMLPNDSESNKAKNRRVELVKVK